MYGSLLYYIVFFVFSFFSKKTIRVDLHNKSVKAARQIVDNKISSYKSVKNCYDSNSLLFISGRGKSSRDGIPKIRPNLVEYFKSNNIRYKDAGKGAFRVSIKQL